MLRNSCTFWTLFARIGLQLMCSYIRWLPPNSWLVGCLGFNGPLRQYFSLYRTVSQRSRKRKENKKKKKTREKKCPNNPPPAPTASAIGPCPTIIHISRTPRHSTFAPPDHPVLRIELHVTEQLYLWCTKRVKSTDTGRPVFQKYGPTRKKYLFSFVVLATRISGWMNKKLLSSYSPIFRLTVVVLFHL